MDYCHPCRRHLNGALACPGCGTPVEEPRAHPPGAVAPPQDAYEYEGEYTYDDGTRDGDEGDGGRDDDGKDGPTGRAARRREQGRGRDRSRGRSGDGPAGPDASRRDRKAAVHRRRRRRTLLIAGALV